MEPHTVLLANGTAKPISKIKAGDKVTASVPGGRTETHTVQRVIVTRTDHDFVDLTIATSKPSRGPPAKLTTTATHPFYDLTQSAFVDAAHIKPGDKLQQPDGHTATVQAVHHYRTTQLTYDLTINGLHTYYVMAGTTPVLVHNCGPEARAAAQAAPGDATMSAAARFRNTDMVSTGYSGHSSRPAFIEPEIKSALADGGQIAGRGADNCAEIRACNALIAEHAADFWRTLDARQS